MKIYELSMIYYVAVLIKNCKFSDFWKYDDVTPVFKKGDKADNSTYRSINTLSNFSKILEKLIYSLVNSFMEPKLSKFLAGFRKKPYHFLLMIFFSLLKPLHFATLKILALCMYPSDKIVDIQKQPPEVFFVKKCS